MRKVGLGKVKVGGKVGIRIHSILEPTDVLNLFMIMLISDFSTNLLAPKG